MQDAKVGFKKIHDESFIRNKLENKESNMNNQLTINRNSLVSKNRQLL